MTLTTTATELSRLMVCIGSRMMPSVLPDGGNKDDRDEGNAAHWLAEMLFNAPPGVDGVRAGAQAPNGYVITDDMVDYVSQYVDALHPGGSMETDTTWAGETFEVRGRADYLVYREGYPPRYDQHGEQVNIPSASTLTIDDFKYGWRLVSPVRNWTLISHAIGWIIRNEIAPDRIVLRIHQPRPHHPDGQLREWSCSYEELMGFYHQIAHRLFNPTDELVSSVDQCAKCHARYDCRAFDQAVYNSIDVATTVFRDDLPKQVLAREYQLFAQAESMIKIAREAREELITHRIKQGDVFEGLGLENRLGQRRWKTGLTGKALSAAAGVDLVKDGLVTPAEAERRGVSKEVVAALVERPSLPPKLKAIDADAKARAVFGDG